MQQEKALKILKENQQAIADEYGVKKLGVFPWEETTECGRCCGYHPQIGVAVEYKAGVKASLFDFAGLKVHIQDLFGCDVSLLDVDGEKDPAFWRDDSVLEEVIYVR